MIYIFIFLFAVLVWLFWILLFRKINILDKPWPDIIPARLPVPNIQWIFLFFWVIISILIFFYEYIFYKEIIALFIAWFFIALVSLFDAFKSISPKIRLLVQISVAMIAFFVGWVGIHDFIMPWWDTIHFPLLLSLLLTIIWFAWFMNAINWFDWVNSLASWVSTIWFLSIILLIQFVVIPYYTWISPDTLYMLEMVINVSYIFFVFSLIYTFIEFKPFWILRDIWVMFLWFSLAYLALMWWAKIWTILVALSLVVFDSIWVFIHRIFVMKKNPLKWDYTHLHYRLLALSWNRTEVRFFVRWWSLFLMIIMLLLWVDRFWKLIIFIIMFLFFFWINAYLFWIKWLKSEYLKFDKLK